MTIDRISQPKHLSIHFTGDEYEAIERVAAASGQAVDDAVYAALLVKLGATMQGFVSENGLQDLVIEVHIETFADDVTQTDLDALDHILGDALLADGSIDFEALDTKTEITNLDDWERNP